MTSSDPLVLLRPLGTLVLLFLAGLAAQSTLAYPIQDLLRAQPDFLLTILLCGALLSDAATGCVLGFAGGLLAASLTGETVGTLLVTRTAAGFTAGRLAGHVFDANTLVVAVGVFVASLATYLLETLVAPPQGTGFVVWLQATLGGAIWNALISLPIAALLRRSGWGIPNPRLR